MKKVVTPEAVESAIEQIQEQGERVTIERIRQITGGSPQTISRIKQSINNNTVYDNTLSLIDSNPATTVSYCHIEKRIDTMIAKRIETIIVERVNTVLSQFEGKPETPSISEATKEVNALKTQIKQLEERAFVAEKGYAELEKQLEEEREKTQQGRRVFKDELALAIHYLVITIGMPQKEVAELLKIDIGDVSKLKNKGTKLRQQERSQSSILEKTDEIN